MKTTPRNAFAVAVLTALGVLPVPAHSAEPRSALSRLSPIELDLATIVAAIKLIPSDIRAGRLGH